METNDEKIFGLTVAVRNYIPKNEAWLVPPEFLEIENGKATPVTIETLLAKHKQFVRLIFGDEPLL